MDTHKEVDLAPYPVVGLVLKVGDTEKFPHALGFESLDPFFFFFFSRVSKQGAYFTARKARRQTDGTWNGSQHRKEQDHDQQHEQHECRY